MKTNPSDPATQGDVQYLAELITQNTVRMDGFDRRMDGFEKSIYDLTEIMEQRFGELKKIIQNTMKYLGRHEDSVEDHEQRIRVLEKAA